MDKLIEILKNPFDGLNENDANGFQDKCFEIAKKLMKEFCIQCGKKKYFFAELEIYYYQTDRWNKEWNEKTYPRKNKKAGDFFFHYSGFDICFDSNFDEKMAKFGGILIRSLKDEKGNFITGPSVCSLELMNVCYEQKKCPEIKPCSNIESEICKNPIKRYGITYNDGQEDQDLCFYDELIKKNLKNEFKNATWKYSKDKSGKVIGTKDLIRYYNRFK